MSASNNSTYPAFADSTIWKILSSWDITAILFVLVVVVSTIIVASIVDKLLKNKFKTVSQRMNVDETIYGVVRRITVALVYLTGVILVITRIPFLQELSLALFAGAGFAGIVVGMAAQSTLANIISGISMATFKPFRVGDRVDIRGEYGKVSDITLRHTVVTTWDNRRLIIPNHIISDEAIINWSIVDPTVLWHVDIGIGYDSDIDLARKIMIEEVNKHEHAMSLEQIQKYDPTLTEKDCTVVKLTELGDFAVNMKLLFWVADRSLAYTMACDIREAVKKRFDAEGIEIPYPYRTILYKKDMMEDAESSGLN
ncbi:MAG: mechanosensitive ion channel family protein [Methanosarcinaceae archaeon]|nr:mechanosensitive ion channel family protein [Methanosarcinaceae archaeon]